MIIDAIGIVPPWLRVGPDTPVVMDEKCDDRDWGGLKPPPDPNDRHKD